MNVYNFFVFDIIIFNFGVKVFYDDNDVIFVVFILDFLQYLIYLLCDVYFCIIVIFLQLVQFCVVMVLLLMGVYFMSDFMVC